MQFRERAQHCQSNGWLLAARNMSEALHVAGSVLLYVSVGFWAHLFMYLVTAPIIGFVMMMTQR